jgi:hypothetical protein
VVGATDFLERCGVEGSCPLLSHSPPVHMYSHSSPLYHFQGPYLQPTTSRPNGLMTCQKSTHR